VQVELPNHDVLLIREADEISERSRRKITAAITRLTANTVVQVTEQDPSALGIAPEDMAALDAANDECALALIVSWKRGDVDVIPSVEQFLELSAKDYGAIMVALDPIIRAISLDFDPTPDHETPTVPDSV
jgi:hypothetical protein